MLLRYFMLITDKNTGVCVCCMHLHFHMEYIYLCMCMYMHAMHGLLDFWCFDTLRKQLYDNIMPLAGVNTDTRRGLGQVTRQLWSA